MKSLLKYLTIVAMILLSRSVGYTQGIVSTDLEDVPENVIEELLKSSKKSDLSEFRDWAGYIKKHADYVFVLNEKVEDAEIAFVINKENGLKKTTRTYHETIPDFNLELMMKLQGDSEGEKVMFMKQVIYIQAEGEKTEYVLRTENTLRVYNEDYELNYTRDRSNP